MSPPPIADTTGAAQAEFQRLLRLKVQAVADGMRAKPQPKKTASTDAMPVGPAWHRRSQDTDNGERYEEGTWARKPESGLTRASSSQDFGYWATAFPGTKSRSVS